MKIETMLIWVACKIVDAIHLVFMSKVVGDVE